MLENSAKVNAKKKNDVENKKSSENQPQEQNKIQQNSDEKNIKEQPQENIENKRKMFNRWTSESLKLGYSKEKANEVAKCTQMSILSKYSFDDYQKMGKEKWNQTVMDLFNKCSIK